MAPFACLKIWLVRLLFLVRTVFFSHNKSAETVFWLLFPAKRMGPKALLEHLCCRLAPPAGVHPLCCACLCFMLLFALVCPVVGWCCRSRLLLCSGCFAAIALLGRMFCRHVARAVALPPVSLRSPLSGRDFAAGSVIAPHQRMLCRFDGRRLWRMLCHRAAVRADALSPWSLL